MYIAYIYVIDRVMVYFLRFQNYVKIGKTNNIYKRMSSLQTNIPFKLDCVLLLNGGYSKEKELHDLFVDYRVSGEWYEYSCVKSFIDSAIENGEDIRWREGLTDKQKPDVHMVRRARIDSGMTRDQMAERMGVTKGAIQKMEERALGENITLRVLRKMADALGCEFEYRFRRIDR